MPSVLRSPESLEIPDVPVGALLDGAARRWGTRTAFVHHDRTCSYADLWRHACGFAHRLQERGVRPGDVVGVHLPNCLAWPVAYHGILLAGATMTPTSPALPAAERHAQLADAGAVAVVTTDATLRGAIVTDGVTLGEEPADAPPEVDVDPRVAVAHLAYTGGTTGRSKGVVLTHAAVVTNALQAAHAVSGAYPVPDTHGGITVEQTSPPSEHPTRLGEGVSIAIAPWFHAMGTNGMTGGLIGGATSIVHERFDPARYLADAETHRVTSMSGAPPMFHALLAHPDAATRDLGSVRSVTSGASPMPVALARRIAELMPDAAIFEGYGLTEATMMLTYAPSARSAHRRTGTVGVPVADTEIELLPVETGRPGDQPVPVGEAGEVWARGPQLMRGYHQRPDETADTLVDGWLRTGDIGTIGDDGLLAIVDRAKDMLLYKGYNVFPRELEERLTHLPEVRAAAVVGLRDDAVGELPVAAVVLGSREDASDDVVRQVVESVNAEVRPYERLRAVFVVDELPTSAAGKVLKRELRDLVAEREPAWRERST